MKYLIKSKYVSLNKDISSVGQYFSNDRFYSLMNKYVSENIEARSRFVSFVVDYLFYSNDYVKTQYMKKSRRKVISILDTICILCLLSFLIIFVAVIGSTLANARKLIETTIGGGAMSVFTKFGDAFFQNVSQNVTLLTFSLIFLMIFIWWIIIYNRFRKKFRSMSIHKYLITKIDFCSRSKWIIETLRKTKNKIGINDNGELSLTLVENFDTHDKKNDLWLNLQIINKICNLFLDFNIIFEINIKDEEQLNNLNTILENDFENLVIEKIK